MSRTMEFEVIAVAGENLEDFTWVTVQVTEEEQQQMQASERTFSFINEDSALAGLTERVQNAASSSWTPFTEEGQEELSLPDSSEYLVDYPKVIVYANRKKLSAQRTQYKLRGLRWGYDGGGVACGPIEGAKVIEAMVSDNSGQLLFVSLSRFMEFAKVSLSRAPLFDLLMELPDPELSFDRENKILESLTVESWEFKYSAMPFEMMSSNLAGIFRLLLEAESHCPCDDRGEDFDGAQRFLSDYRGKSSVELLPCFD